MARHTPPDRARCERLRGRRAHVGERCGIAVLASLVVVLLVLPLGAPATTEPLATPARHDVAQIQAVVDGLRGELAIPQEVVVALVTGNALVVSVERMRGRDAAFLLSIETDFLHGLDDDDLRAVVAHELGHVWIFTHHPFLHTERLANQIAMRAVSRESLARVYDKVWARVGTKGDLDRFLGAP